jgi:hypothetical protein
MFALNKNKGKNMKKLIFTVLTICNLNAYAGNDTGGGGGFCINNKCVTLAEAGFRIQDESTYEAPVIGLEVFTEVRNIVNQLTVQQIYKDILINDAVAKPGVYKKVLSYNSQTLEKIKMEYLAVLESQHMSSENLVFYALSDKKKSYLLPEFEKLNTRSKALILIHEGVVRRTGSVINALKVDGAILDTLNGKYKNLELIEAIAMDDNYADRLLVEYIRHATEDMKKSFSFNDLSIPKPSTLYFETKNKMYSAYPYQESIHSFNNYCLSSSDEAALYQNQSGLWKIMKKYSKNCFYIEQADSLYQVLDTFRVLGETLCKKIVSGDAVIATSLERTLIGIECSGSSLENFYTIAF